MLYINKIVEKYKSNTYDIDILTQVLKSYIRREVLFWKVFVLLPIQVPLCRHKGEQIGYWHIDPLYPVVQLHVLGPIHVPPCSHAGEHVANNI
jgi:hypothetical protein